MAVGDVYRLAVQWNEVGGANTLVNVFHYRQEDPTILDTPGEDLVQAFISDALTTYRALTTATFTVSLFRTQSVADPLETYEQTHTGGGGTQAGEGLPYQCAPLISWRTGGGGRRGRGRTYAPPCAEGNTANGGLGAGELTALTNFGNAALSIGDGIATSFWTLGVQSSVDGIFRPITSFIVRDMVFTQRRRTRAYGN